MTRHIVLIHGAWQGAWAFDAWLPLLRERGWQPHAVDLPGNGWPPLGDAPASLDSYTAHVAGVIDALGEPAVVLGHSGGGITASQVAEALPERVAALVYLAGMMLPSGVGFGELVRQVHAEQPDRDFSGITPWLQWNADRSASRVPADGALRCFVHDCEPAAAAQAAALLRPQPESGRAMINRLSAERFGRVPRFYVECLDDRSVYHPLQARMQQLSPGAHRLTLPCGHVPQLAAPQALTDLLMPELEALLP
ncbi:MULTISPECIES: alpha/beta fold hydrolase [Pseudacidovorax]|uniref:alpha/beta fold hydrolase n=1 Tax=Pseudacidovorax TaxID=433923 RepID=UPI001F2DC50D|nr:MULTISPECIES: alpha/beta hydrolase [Pseudacidovorax]